MSTTISIASAIRSARKSAGLTQEQLAMAIGGAGQSTIGNYERGVNQPDIETLKRIATACGVRVIDFFQSGNYSAQESPAMYQVPPVRVRLVAQLPLSEIRPDLVSNMDAKNKLAIAHYSAPATSGPNTFAIAVPDLSMRDDRGLLSYFPSDIIFIDPDVEPANGRRVLVYVQSRKQTMFRNLIIEGNHRFLVALNPMWPGGALELQKEDTILGVAIGRYIPET